MWHLAINNLFGRRLRSALLAGSVALATTLIVAMAASIDTLGASIQLLIGRRVGLSDVQIVHQYHMHLNDALLEQMRHLPSVRIAAGSFDTGATASNTPSSQSQTVSLRGIEPGIEYQLNPPMMREGRSLQSSDEAVITPAIARKLNLGIGDTLTITTHKTKSNLTVVGIINRPKLDILQKRLVIVTLDTVRQLSGVAGKLTNIDIQLTESSPLQPFIKAQADAISATSMGAIFRPTAAAATRVNRGMRQVRLILAVLTSLVFLSAGFIILTGLTTGVIEQMRELAILRSIGASPWQIAGAQLLSGALLAGGGALLGIAPGLAMSYLLYHRHAKGLPAGFSPSVFSIGQAVAAAIIAGLFGAAYPAWRAAQANPAQGLNARATQPSNASILSCLFIAIPLIAAPVLAHQLAQVQHVFWAYLYVGLPLMFIGYFLLTVPLMVLVAHTISPLIATLLRVPRQLLSQQLLATPFRLGFTGGALMVALAMLVAIWTSGSSVMKGWVDQVHMPDGFAHSFYGFTQEQLQALKTVDVVTDLCPTTAFPVIPKSASFGIESLAPRATLFVSTDTDALIRMIKPHWVQGDPVVAAQRLREGGALLVTEQYLTAHNLGVGSTLTLSSVAQAQGVNFEIVGVITSPGLEVAVRFFGIHRAFGDAAVASVFGTPGDAAKYFGVDKTNLVLLSFHDHQSDEKILSEIRRALPGVIVGLSRKIRQQLQRAVTDTMAFFSAIAGAALLMACLGVGQLIFASLQARWFEMGILRAIGASPAMLGRLVAAQTIMIVLVAVISGTALGLQIALIHRMFHQRLFGVSYEAIIPWPIIAAGSSVVMVMALLAAAPSIWRVYIASPRRLLSTH